VRIEVAVIAHAGWVGADRCRQHHATPMTGSATVTAQGAHPPRTMIELVCVESSFRYMFPMNTRPRLSSITVDRALTSAIDRARRGFR